MATIKKVKDTIYIVCPKCGSQNIIKNGIRGNKHRLKCNKCSLNFTKPMPTQ